VNARFAVMCAHYLFDPDFCNVAAGWEKGIVEKNVQDSRRRIWLAAQDCQFHSFEELNAWLGQRYRALWRELAHPQYSGLSVAEVLELERAEMMPRPAAFDGYVERAARASSTCLVSVGRNRYSVPCERADQWVSSRLYPTRIEVVADDVLIASHSRLLDRDQVSYDWQHYIPLIERSRGRCAMERLLPICRSHCVSSNTAWSATLAVTGSWRRFWPPCRSPDSMPCWWSLNWCLRAAA
jgi:hypothetical protein